MSSATVHHFAVSWDAFHRDSRALAWRLLEIEKTQGYPWEGIVAVTRGGLVPAAIVARELDKRLIETFCIKSYDDKKLDEVQVIRIPESARNGKGWLIVDDLVDTGRTARLIREKLPEAHFATVYAKPEGRPTVDTFITEVSQNTWILFPWDLELTDAIPIVQR